MGKGTAVVTGASAGIGVAYARDLARRGYDLLLTARRSDRLDALAGELREAFGVSVTTYPADLADAEQTRQLCAAIGELPNLTLLVNNAGFGTMGFFHDSDIEKQVAMVDVHVSATLRLCRAALPGMIARRHGRIINVSSIAAFFNGTTYSATKAALNTFSLGLQSELNGVPGDFRVQALCPGYTYSEFHDTPDHAGFNRSNVPASMWMTSEDVVARSLAALESRRRVILIPGWRNRVLVVSMRTGLRPVVRKVRDRLLRR